MSRKSDDTDSQDREKWPDERLLRAASLGDQRAFEVFCVRRLPGVLRYMRRKCSELAVPMDLAGDFVQETFLRALRQIRNTQTSAARPQPKVSVAWIFQVGFNVLIDWKRKNRRLVNFENLQDIASRNQVDEATTERYEQVLKYFNWLQSDDRELLEAILIDEMGIVDAGARIGLSASASYKRYERALQHLRDLMEEHG